MKLTLKTIVVSQEALGRLGREKFTGANAGKIVYAIAKNIALTESHVIAYQKARNAIIEKYRVKKFVNSDDEKDIPEEEKWVIPDSAKKSYEAEFDELNNTEEDVDVRIVTLPSPSEGKPLQINGVDRFLLDWMVKVEGEE